MPILVTGAAGFAGSYVIEALAGSGDTIGWTHRSSPPGEVAPLAAWERVDLLNPGEVRDAIARIKPSAVIHCAGAANVAHSWRDTLTPLSVNVLATHHLFDALRRAGARVPRDRARFRHRLRTSVRGADGRESCRTVQSVRGQQARAGGSLPASRARDGVEVIVTRSFNHTGPGRAPRSRRRTWRGRLRRSRRDSPSP